MNRTKSEFELHVEAATGILKERIDQNQPLTPEEEKCLRAMLNKCVKLEDYVKLLFPRHRLKVYLEGETDEEKGKQLVTFVEDFYLFISEANHWLEDTVTYGFVNWFQKSFICNLPEKLEHTLLERMVKNKYE